MRFNRFLFHALFFTKHIILRAWHRKREHEWDVICRCLSTDTFRRTEATQTSTYNIQSCMKLKICLKRTIFYDMWQKIISMKLRCKIRDRLPNWPPDDKLHPLNVELRFVMSSSCSDSLKITMSGHFLRVRLERDEVIFDGNTREAL